MRVKVWTKRSCVVCLVGLCAALAGCGGSDNNPPVSYMLGENEIPALTKLVSVGNSMQFQEEAPEGTDTSSSQSEATTYLYTGLEAGNETAQEYVQILQDGYGAAVVDESGAEQEPPDFTQESGTVLVGLDGLEEDTLCLLTIRWEKQSCSITPELRERAQIHTEESLTVAEAVEELKNKGTVLLGLPGDNVDQYLFLPKDGVVLVDDRPCFQINVYGAEDHQIAGVYMLSETGDKLYRLDQGDNTVEELQ